MPWLSIPKEAVYLAGYSRNRAQPFVWLKKYASAGKEDAEAWNKKFNVDLVGGTVEPRLALDSKDNVYLGFTGRNLVSPESGLDWWVKR